MFSRLHAVRADFCPCAGGKPHPLEVGLAAARARGVKLRRADAVRIAAADLRPFFTEWALFGHKNERYQSTNVY